MENLLLPQRCAACAAPALGLLCRACSARYRPHQAPAPPLGLCPVCGVPRLAETGPCTDCAASSWSFQRLEGVLNYQESAAELLRAYKFGGRADLADLWARWTASRLDPLGPVVPVPALASHRRERGWDPVDRFARKLAREAGCPYWPVLVRGASAAQKTLSREGRRENAARAYRLPPSARGRFSGVALVWLVDDVVTTGATAEACAGLLREAGASEVRVLCLGLH